MVYREASSPEGKTPKDSFMKMTPFIFHPGKPEIM